MLPSRSLPAKPAATSSLPALVRCSLTKSENRFSLSVKSRHVLMCSSCVRVETMPARDLGGQTHPAPADAARGWRCSGSLEDRLPLGLRQLDDLAADPFHVRRVVIVGDV